MNRGRSGIWIQAASCGVLGGMFLLSGLALRAQQTPAPDADPPADVQVRLLARPPERLTLDARFTIYRRGLMSPVSLLGPVVGAAVGQWRDSPEQWGQGAQGYGRRLASGYGRSVTSSTIAFGVAAIDHEDPRFMPSHASGPWNRTAHAIAGTFITHTDRSSAWMPAYSRLAGSYGAAFLANAWYPRNERSAGDVFERGSTALLSSIVWRVMREFGPDIRKIVAHD